jgi:hypothetical protein
MPLSNSVLRRYTPPTCTLEIVAKSSPLSRWTRQPILKQLRFELHFDDPRQSETQRVTVRGDRIALEALCDTVNTYVHNFLLPSPHQEALPLWKPSAATQDIFANESPQEPESLQTLALPSPGSSNRDVLALPTKIHLQPRGLVAHDLFLGSLATAETGAVVGLSAVQLFDLATALDEYATEMLALPSLDGAAGQRMPPAWARIAAGAVLAVGVTTAIVKIIDQPYQQETASTQDPTLGETPAIEQLQPLPAAPIPITPIPSPTLPSPLATRPILPPPPAVTVPSPAPGAIPPPVTQPPSRPLTILPNDSAALSSRQARSGTPALTIPALPRQQTAPSPGRIAALPQPAPNSSPLLKPAPIDSLAAPRAAAGSTESRSSPSPILSRPATTPPSLPNLPPLQPTPPTELAQRATPSVTPSGISRTTAALAEPESTTANDAEEKPSLFDTVPQVAEVRSYFQQRWEPPTGLTQSLEYSLLLNRDGSIQRIIPRGKAAEDYIDRTDIPLIGEKFVSAVEGERNPRIRLVLAPDGKVETFLERMN